MQRPQRFDIGHDGVGGYSTGTMDAAGVAGAGL
jgi:hypothetical protein